MRAPRLIHRNYWSANPAMICSRGGTTMTMLDQTSTSLSVPSSKRQNWIKANWGLIFAAAALLVILLVPTPAGLSLAGHRMLAVFGFAVVVWVTDALDYAVSAVVIAAL